MTSTEATRTAGGTTGFVVRSPESSSFLDPEYRLVRIHDEKQEMNISGSGATDELVQSILESCASDRRTPIE